MSQQRTVSSEAAVSKERPDTGQQKARLSLFDDEDEDNNEDLFAVSSTSTASKTTKTTTVGTSAVVYQSCSLHTLKYQSTLVLIQVLSSWSHGQF